MTTRALTLSETIAAVAMMERNASVNGRRAVGLAMHPTQWAGIVNETLCRLRMTAIPKEMCSIQPGTLGQIHGLIVLPMAAQGVALFYA